MPSWRRVLGASAGQAQLQPYQARIERAFDTRGGRPQLKLSEGRKAIREYQAATDDPVGSLELMMTFVETGTPFTSEFGDIDEPFDNSLSSVLHEMDQILKSSKARSCPRGFGSACWSWRSWRAGSAGATVMRFGRGSQPGKSVSSRSSQWTAGESHPDFRLATAASSCSTSSPCMERSSWESNPDRRLTRAVCCPNTSRPCKLRRPDLNRRGTAYETVLGTRLQSTPQYPRQDSNLRLPPRQGGAVAAWLRG